MYSNILITIINLLAYFYNDKQKAENDYTKERKIYYNEKIFKILLIANIANIVTEILALIIIAIDKASLSIFYILLSLASIISFILLLTKKRTKKRLKIIDKKIINENDIALLLSSFIFQIASWTNLEKNGGLVFLAIDILLIIFTIGFLIYKLIKVREHICYNHNEEDYFKDIKFTKKIELNKAINYITYIFVIILFVLIRIPYIFIFYIIIDLLIIRIIYKKYKKIKYQTDLLYKKITIANESPGIIYAFQFERDILLFKKLLIILIIYTVSIASIYIVGESAFILTSVGFFILLLHIIINDKIYLIKCIKSYNSKFIDNKKYTIDVIKKINYIDTIKLFNINLYKIIISDNINYESNIILYDPDTIIDELEIRINKSNLEDYVIIENILYEEE